MDANVKESTVTKDKLIKVIFLILFGVIGYFAQMLVWVIAVVQFIFLLAMGAPNQKLLEFGKRLSTYLYQIMQYLTFNVADRPFPFSDFPKAGQ